MIFVDSSFLIAGLVAEDAYHHQAVELFRASGGRRLVTTNHIRGETWTFLRRKKGHQVGVRFLSSLSFGNTAVAHLDDDLEREALDWLRAHDEREYSFVDATSFAFMRRNGIAEALAFDGDFAAAGFVELRP